MKTNIIKGGKSALSILLAIAMLAVSIFTVNIGISASAAQPTDEWDGAYTIYLLPLPKNWHGLL